jgi:branched-chain amino acid transport system permease protein
VGAFAFNYLEVFAVGATVYWQLVLGVVLVALVLAMPAGLLGTASQILARLRRRA